MHLPLRKCKNLWQTYRKLAVAELSVNLRCLALPKQPSSLYKEIKASFLYLNLFGIFRFFTKYCIMQYFTFKYCSQITVCVMRKIIVCKNILIMLCIRAMCGVKMIEKRRSQELMSLLGLKDTLDELARVSGVRWYGYVLRRDNDDVWRKA